MLNYYDVDASIIVMLSIFSLLIQGKEQWLRFAGAAVKRYPMSEVRETQVRG